MKYSAISINLATVRLDLQISRPTLYRFALWLAAGNVLTRPAGSVGLLFPLLLQHMEPRASLCILSLWLKCCLCRPAAMAKRGASTVVEGFASRAIVPVRRDDFGGGLELWVPSEQQHRWDKKHSGKRRSWCQTMAWFDTLLILLKPRNDTSRGNVGRVGCNWGVLGTRVLRTGGLRVGNGPQPCREQTPCDQRVGNKAKTPTCKTSAWNSGNRRIHDPVSSSMLVRGFRV